MDLKETIKQQGTQASALLPELQEYVDSKVEELRGGGEYIVELSCEGFSGTLEELTINGLKGRQNILAMWDKLRNGEIQRDKIRVVLKIPVSEHDPTPHIHEAIESMVKANTLDSANFYAVFYISSTKIFSCRYLYNEHIDSKYNTSLIAYLPGDSTPHTVTGEFTD